MKRRVLPVIRWLHVVSTIHFFLFAAKFQQIPFSQNLQKKNILSANFNKNQKNCL
jgi:hypothetical protein